MRQVDREELTYVIYCGLRTWTTSTRKTVFARPNDRRDAHRSIACDKVAVRILQYMEVLDPARPDHPLDVKDISAEFVQALDSFPGAIARLWDCGVHQRALEAQSATANLFADALDQFQIFADTSLGANGVQVVFPKVVVAPHALQPSWP